MASNTAMGYRCRAPLPKVTMRPALLALMLSCTAMLPTIAQEVPVVPSAAAAFAMRCAVAFGVMRERLTAAGDEDGAADYDGKAASAFTTAATELIPAGMSVEQFGVLAESYVAEVTAPFREQLLSEAECAAAIAR